MTTLAARSVLLLQLAFTAIGCASTEPIAAADRDTASGRDSRDSGGRAPGDRDTGREDSGPIDVGDDFDGTDGPDSGPALDAGADTGRDAGATPESCGNGVVDDGEECDDGAGNSDVLAGACRTDCTRARCGDGVTDTGEECDDGDDVDNNACGNACIFVAADLCRPCTGDADCGRDADRCIEVAGGRACGILCASDDDCPDAYRCATLGDGGKQCQPESGACEACSDPDSDGWGVGADCPNPGIDCAPDDEGTNPGAAERCDGLDNNCSGSADEGLPTSTWYRDGDGDNVGHTDSPYVGCSAPSGYVGVGGDCLDTDGAVFPGRAEVCDGRDNDCSGVADDGITTTLYPDNDGDGFGNAAGPTSTGCPRAGWVTNGTDCDDANPSAAAASAEVCDGRDNDCDGQIDDAAGCPCEVRTNAGHGYMFCSRPRSWSDASSFCQGYGYRLATVGDAGENEWIRSTHNSVISGGCTNTCGDHATDSSVGVPDDGWCDDEQYCRWGTDCGDCGNRSGPPGNTWIGFNDRSAEGSFAWHSGAAVTFTNWNSGEPNDSSGEDCAELRTSNGAWNDKECDDFRTFVCESL